MHCMYTYYTIYTYIKYKYTYTNNYTKYLLHVLHRLIRRLISTCFITYLLSCVYIQAVPNSQHLSIYINIWIILYIHYLYVLNFIYLIMYTIKNLVGLFERERDWEICCLGSFLHYMSATLLHIFVLFFIVYI